MTVVYDATKGRSVVAPAAQLPPLLFKVRGTIGNRYGGQPQYPREDQSGDFDLKLTNSAGALQPAASFHQFMRVVLTDLAEAYKDKDRELREQRQEAEDDSDSSEDAPAAALRRARAEDVWHWGYDNPWERFKTEKVWPILSRHDIPWPLEGMLEHGLGTWILDKLLKGVARRRRDAVMLRLVILNTPNLAGVSYLFEEFLPMIGVVPTFKSLNRCLRNLEQGYDGYAQGLEPDPYDIDSYHTALRRDGNATGELQYDDGLSTVRWSCAPPDGPHVDSSDSSDSEESEPDY